jgi:hypoxanthine phosphoribosyltransferase
LRWDSEGNVIEAFAPDFYLPEQDLYIELTTMRQSLVNRKNRKLRRLKELYPEINIKLLYRGDYQALLEKYGIEQESEQA